MTELDLLAQEEVVTQTVDQMADQTLDSNMNNEMEFLRLSAIDGSDIAKEDIEANTQAEDDSAIKDEVVMDDSLDRPMTSKYPLKYRWQMWFWRANQGVKVVWTQALQKVCQPFDTIEGFWRLYHHILCVHQLVPPSDYYVFKEGMRPMWEDPHNINGGKWTLDFPKTANRMVNPHLDEIWLEVLLCLIGEGFNEFSEDICGAVVNIRSKDDRISVWTANAHKSVANLKIGEILKIRSGYEGKMKYEAHSTSQKIAEEKDRLFDTRINIPSKSRAKPQVRRSCVF